MSLKAKSSEKNKSITPPVCFIAFGVHRDDEELTWTSNKRVIGVYQTRKSATEALKIWARQELLEQTAIQIGHDLMEGATQCRVMDLEDLKRQARTKLDKMNLDDLEDLFEPSDRDYLDSEKLCLRVEEFEIQA